MIGRFEKKRRTGKTRKSYRAFHEYLVAKGYSLSESALIKHVYHCVRPNAEDT